MSDLVAGLVGVLLACALPIGVLLGFGIPYLVTMPKRKREDAERRKYMGWD